MEYYVLPNNYLEQLESKRDKDFHSLLSNIASKAPAPSVVVSRTAGVDAICLESSAAHESSVGGCVFIPEELYLNYCAAFAMRARDLKNIYEKVVLDYVFSFPAGKIEPVVEAIIDVATYRGKLPFYAVRIPLMNPSEN